jgi:hypothetical protein
MIDFGNFLQRPHIIVDGQVVFDPPLTPGEQAEWDALLKLASMLEPMSTAQYDALRPQMQTLRELRQLGRNAFMALTAADRDRMIYDALVAQTIIDLALLRDS